MSKQSVKVTIFGKKYVVSTDQGEESILEASQMVDALMREVAQKVPALQESKAAVLASLHLAADLVCKKREEQLTEKALDRLNILLEEYAR